MATGDTYADLFTVLKYASGKPAAETQIGYAALTFAVLGGVVSLPQRGDTVEDISEPTLADGRVEHFNGLKDGQILEIPIKHIEGDAGQAAMLGAAGSNTVFSFQEIDPDAEAHFYHGRVQSFQRREATTSSNKGYILMIAVNSGRFVGTATA